jgi:hypothetical protein
MAEQTLVGQGLLSTEASRLHSDTSHWVDSSGRVIGPKQRLLRDTTQHRQGTTILATGGIQTHSPSKRSDATHALDRAAKVSSRDVKFGV